MLVEGLYRAFLWLIHYDVIIHICLAAMEVYLTPIQGKAWMITSHKICINNSALNWNRVQLICGKGQNYVYKFNLENKYLYLSAQRVLQYMYLSSIYIGFE